MHTHTQKEIKWPQLTRILTVHTKQRDFAKMVQLQITYRTKELMLWSMGTQCCNSRQKQVQH